MHVQQQNGRMRKNSLIMVHTCFLDRALNLTRRYSRNSFRSKTQQPKTESIGCQSRRLSGLPPVNFCDRSIMDTIPLLPDFLDLLRFLNEEKVEYLVIGGNGSQLLRGTTDQQATSIFGSL